MPAPTVTRPSAATASVAETPESEKTGLTNEEWAKYAVWGVIALVAVAVLAFAFTGIVTYSESAHTKKLRAEWDEYFNAVNDKKSDEDRIEALEKLSDNPKIQGTAVHAYALMSMARMNFEISINPRKQPETRAAAVDRAAKLYELVATTEPFKGNPSFGAGALQDLACAYEQKQMSDTESTKFYDLAITALRGAMYTDLTSKDPEPVKLYQTHYLFDKLNAELGRLYWLRSQRKAELKKAEIVKKADDARKAEEAKDPKKAEENKKPEEMKKAEEAVNAEVAKEVAAVSKADNEFALVFVKKALEAGVTTVEKERYEPNFKGAWREEAAYIKSLLDPNGKMMPDGKAPAVKAEEPAPAAGGPNANATDRATTLRQPKRLKKLKKPKRPKRLKTPGKQAKPRSRTKSKKTNPRRMNPRKTSRKKKSQKRPVAPIVAQRKHRNHLKLNHGRSVPAHELLADPGDAQARALGDVPVPALRRRGQGHWREAGGIASTREICVKQH